MENLNYVASSPLAEISLPALEANDDAQVQSMIGACITDGCFFLDLTGKEAEAPGATLQSMAQEVIASASNFFDLDLDTKLQYEMDKWGDLQIGG